MIGIGLLGLGTVGTGVYEILEEKRKEFKKLLGREPIIKKVLVQDLDKKRDTNIDEDLLTSDFLDLIEDKDIEVLIEVTGDLDRVPAFLKEAIEKGLHVITANKAIVSRDFEELSQLAEEKEVAFLYEASVGGGIPLIGSLKDQLRFNEVSQLKGILNGTCNFILSQMMDQGQDYQEALKEAQALGYAELDPSADVEGLDSLRKLRILASLALQGKVGEEDILLEGIERISAQDCEHFKKMGVDVKLLGQACLQDGGYQAYILPSLVAKDSRLAGVNLAFNLVEFKGDKLDRLTLIGQGAGKFPTANAVVSDLLDLYGKESTRTSPLGNRELVNLNEEFEAQFYLRIDSASEELIQEIQGLSQGVLSLVPSFIALTQKTKLARIYRVLEAHNLDKSSYFIAKFEEE